MRVLVHKKQELELDVKDWRILKELVKNARQPISQIAKRCLLSRQAVEYRLKLLHANNLIMGSRTVINTKKLGYRSYHIFMEVHTPKETKRILSRAMSAPCVNAIIVYSGKYNLEISIMAKTEEEFLNYYEGLINNIRIRDDHLLILLNNVCAEVLPSKHFPRLKGLGQNKMTRLNRRKKDTKYRLDETDIKILFALSIDASRTNVSISKGLGISKDSVSYRIRRLEDNSYILQYRPVVNYSALGLSINSVLIKLNHSSTAAAEFERYLRSNGSILWATKTLGYYNYLIYIITKDLDEFHEVINGIKELFDDIIKTYEILFAFEELKYNFMAESLLRSDLNNS